MITEILLYVHVLIGTAMLVLAVIVWKRMTPGQRWNSLTPPASFEEAMMGRVWDATMWLLIFLNLIVWILVGSAMFRLGLPWVDIIGIAAGLWGVMVGLRYLWREK